MPKKKSKIEVTINGEQLEELYSVYHAVLSDSGISPHPDNKDHLITIMHFPDTPPDGRGTYSYNLEIQTISHHNKCGEL